VDPTAEISRLEEQRWNALTSGDVSALRGLFDDAMSYTHSNGMLDTKQSYLGALESGVFSYVDVTRSDQLIRTFGNTAVVTGKAVIESVAAAMKIQTVARYSAVWAKADGIRWQFVCWHATALPRQSDGTSGVAADTA